MQKTTVWKSCEIEGGSPEVAVVVYSGKIFKNNLGEFGADS